MKNLKNVELFAAETNRTATVKQLYAVASHFAKITDPKLYKVYGAILMKFQAEHKDTPITWKDINTFLNIKTVPKKFADMITKKSEKPKASKTVKKSEPKPVVKTTVVKKETKVSKKASEMSVEEFANKLNNITSRVDNLEKKMATMDTKMDIMMAWLETNPDRF